MTDQNEQWIVRTLARVGQINKASLGVTPSASDALRRLLERGQVRYVGFTDAVELAPAAIPTPETEQACPERPRRHKTYGEGRRQHYSQLTGMLPDRIKLLAARILHWLGSYADEDGENRPVCSKRRLERALHADRLEEWTPAIELLLKHEAIAITGRLVTVLEPARAQSLPDPHDPHEVKREKERKAARKRKRGKRPASPWLLNKIAERKRREQEATGGLSPSTAHGNHVSPLEISQFRSDSSEFSS